MTEIYRFLATLTCPTSPEKLFLVCTKFSATAMNSFVCPIRQKRVLRKDFRYTGYLEDEGLVVVDAEHFKGIVWMVRAFEHDDGIKYFDFDCY